MSEATLTLDTEQLKRLAELLLGAAHADGHFDGLEAGEIGDILHEVVDGDLPSEVSMHLSKFDMADFSVQESCHEIGLDSDEDKRAVISLVTRVTEADSLHDLAETDYIRQVVDAIGGDVEAYEGHMFDVVVVKPPPLPK